MSPRVRVLFVVSFPYWITGEQAHQIVKHNPHVEGVICSVPLVDELFRRTPSLREQIDLVHFMVPIAGTRYLDKFKGKIPCVTTIHHLEPAYHPETVSINSKADGIMVVAETWRSELISRGVPAERIILLPNGVDTSMFRPPSQEERARLRHSMGFVSSETLIGFAGTPGRDKGWRKGLDVFMDALKILAGDNRRIAVVVGGPGWGAALEKIGDMGIKVYRRPYVLDAEGGAPMYRALDFYWVTSRIEGGPVPLLEAMSSGVCCISTKVGIAPEVIQDGISGFLVEIEDAARIAALTSKLMDRKEERKRMGREARSMIVSGYDWSKTAKRASQLYDIALINFQQNYGSIALADNEVGRALLSPQDARWLEAQEQLLWARELCRMRERRAALALGWRASLAYPFTIRTWSFLVNLIVPAPVLELRRLALHRLNG